MLRYEGRTVLITGAASGVGAGCVERFHAEGANVVVADIQAEAGTALVERLGGHRLQFQYCDVGDEGSIAEAVDIAVARYGRLDVAYANAAILGAVGRLSVQNMADVDLTFSVNLRGVFLLMKHAARVMVPQGSGAILATGSPGGSVGGVGPHAYAAAKAGIIGLVRSVAAELRPSGVRVNALVPGAMLTPMTADIMTGDATDLDGASEQLASTNLMGRPGLPSDIAAAAAFLASDDAGFITGATLHVDAGYTNAPGDSPFARNSFADADALLAGGGRARADRNA